VVSDIAAPGINFSFGGAVSGVGGVPPGFLGQFGAFQALTEGGIAAPDENDLISVWIGSNDYFPLIAEGGPFADADAITAAVTTVQTNIATGIGGLYGLGGRNFLVFTQPDLGITADVNASEDPLRTATGQAITTAHNTALQSTITGLQSNFVDANFILVDVNSLFAELLANPSAFGFSNTTDACIFDAACATADQATQNEFIFFDGVHPTTAVHGLLAATAREVLDLDNNTADVAATSETGLIMARNMMRPITGRQLQVRNGLGTAENNGAFTLDNRQLRQLASANANQVNFASDGQGGGSAGSTDRDDDGLSFFLNGQYVDGSRDAATLRSGFEYDYTMITIGADYLSDDNFLFGLAFTYADGDVEQATGGGYDQKSWQIAGYASYFSNQMFIDVYGGYGDTDYEEITRPTGVGPITATGETSGSNFTLGATAGYRFVPNVAVIEPYIGLRYIDLDVDAYQETGGVIFNLDISEQNINSFAGIIGVNVARTFTTEDWSFTPRASVQYEVELDGERSITSSIIGNTANPFVLDDNVLDDNILAVTVGLEATTGNFVLSVDYQTEVLVTGGSHDQIVGQVSFKF